MVNQGHITRSLGGTGLCATNVFCSPTSGPCLYLCPPSLSIILWRLSLEVFPSSLLSSELQNCFSETLKLLGQSHSSFPWNFWRSRPVFIPTVWKMPLPRPLQWKLRPRGNLKLSLRTPANCFKGSIQALASLFAVMFLQLHTAWQERVSYMRQRQQWTTWYVLSAQNITRTKALSRIPWSKGWWFLSCLALESMYQISSIRFFTLFRRNRCNKSM